MSTPSTKIENINQAINLIEKTNINDVIRGLNYLLQKSYEANEITSGSTVIYIEQYPHLLTKLGNLLDVINPSGKLPFEKSLKSQEENYYSFLFGDVAVSSSSGNDSSSSSSNIEWSVELPGADSTFFKFLSTHLDSNSMITVIIGILRNLSFEIANEVYLAYHSTIMRQMTSIMISSILAPKLNENLQLIFEFFMNIGHKLEFNGKKRIQLSSGFLDEHNVYLQPPHPTQQHQLPQQQQQYQQQMKLFLQGKELLKFKMSYEMSNQSTVEYTLAVKSLLAIINALISKDYLINRYYIVKALELLLKLTSNSENENFFMNTPIIFLENLFYLLAVSNITIVESNLQNSIIPENHIIIGDPCGKTRPIIALSTPLIQGNTSSSTSMASSAVSAMTPGGMIGTNSSLSYGNAAASNYVGTTASLATSGAGSDSRIIIPNSSLHDQIDIELRDLVMDALHYLCRISISNRQRFVKIPNGLKLIYKLAKHPLQNMNYYNNVKRSVQNPNLYGSVGSGFGGINGDPMAGGLAGVGSGGVNNIINANAAKTETHVKAAYLFGLFGNVPEAMPVFESLKSELLLLACSDDVFADLVFNKLFSWMTDKTEPSTAAPGMEPMNIN